MDPESSDVSYHNNIDYGEVDESEETDLAIRSITDGYSDSITEQYNRRRNQRDLETENLNAIRSITEDGFSESIAEEQYRRRNKRNREREEMIAIRSITEPGFDPSSVCEEYEEEVQYEEVVQEEEVSQESKEEAHFDEVTRIESPSEETDDAAAPNEDVSAEEDNIEQTSIGLGQAVADHYNQKSNVGVDLRKQSRIVHMRNFNNWIKSMLIGEYLSKCKSSQRGGTVKVLDMGSGKGGDMLKWLNGEVKHVIFADIASVSIEDCKNRYKELKTKEEAKKQFAKNVFSAEFIAADCSKIRLRSHYEDKVVELDLVSCQFCIHYSFESLQQARCMIKNAAECLKVGGFFIGTVPDSNQIMARQRLSNDKSFGNEVYQIECLFDYNGHIPLFGAKYDFNLEGVVNCPEFLVHFGLFEKIAHEYGLKLILKENFKTFYERKLKDSQALNLLRRMHSLETYPPKEDAKLLGQENDYNHAKEFLENNSQIQRLGTLSKAEWEAITLYQVFAFEKVKGTEYSNNIMKRSLEESSSTSDVPSKRPKSGERS